MAYLYFSRKWTHKKDAFLTFWGPNNSGYKWFEHQIGLYKSPDLGDVPQIFDYPVKNIPYEIAKDLFELFIYEGRLIRAIANTNENRKKLRLTKKDFLRPHLSCQLAQIDRIRSLRVKSGPVKVRDEGGMVHYVEGVQTFSVVNQSGQLESLKSYDLTFA